MTRWFAAALVVATFLNGGSAFLKRIGLVERQRYDSYWLIHCGGEGPVPRWWGLGQRCITFAGGPLDPDRFRRERPYFSFVFDVGRGEIPFKAAKDGVMLLGIVGCVWHWRRMEVRGRTPWPLWALGSLVVILAAWSVAEGEPIRAVLGLRGAEFIPLGLFGGWVTARSRLQEICRALIVLLVLQTFLVPVELLRGMPIGGYSNLLALPSRVAGTLVKPNGLGVLAAVVVSLSESFAPNRRWQIVAWLSGTLLILLSGSATGVVVLSSLAFLRVVRHRVSWARILLGSLAAALLFAALPTVVGRPSVFDSLVGPGGRLDRLFAAAPARASLLFGQGLGSGTNVEQVLASTRLEGGSNGGSPLAGADSTPALLLRECGVIGLGLFYAALVTSWRRAPQASPLFLALVLTSLTCNLLEAFPVNVLVGLTLGFSAELEPSTAAS